MEPAQTQLARALPPLNLNFGTANPSIHSDRVSLAYMQQWHSFVRDAFDLFRQTPITHEVAFHDEDELYTVGNELGLTGRFIRNLCDPVMKALKPLPDMSSMRFADIQAICHASDVVPDVSLGLVNSERTSDNVYLVGELKTSWTVPEAYMRLNQPNTSYHLEPLITDSVPDELLGQLANQMRMASLQYGFISTYNSTVFVKRTADTCFLLSQPIKYNALQPSLRQLFAGFCLMALSEPRYHESPSFPATSLRGAPRVRISNRLRGHDDPSPPPAATGTEAITSTSVILDNGSTAPIIVNCCQQISTPSVDDKAVWLASMNNSPVILKCWRPKLDQLFDSEAGVYERIWQKQPPGTNLFARWIAMGRIICSSVFPVGYAIVLQYRDGARLSDIWHTLNELERAYVKTQCLNGINALRQVAVRIDDAGMHNILYSRSSRTVTLLDFETAVEVEPNTLIPTIHEMGAIFGPNAMLGHEHGG
ncbi:hypothetical protein N7449_006319 [Penicillium cf. viridicatum]|uniref:Protein kinase domain-containing protein n=1 Tax=Penicillium cf. viridicatum TaxID=2972119 RepID=A0A9W9JJ35_9EURO|nr:hypothetical protein N7449_006319 [Penicillium cf. viridicatum]